MIISKTHKYDSIVNFDKIKKLVEKVFGCEVIFRQKQRHLEHLHIVLGK